MFKINKEDYSAFVRAGLWPSTPQPFESLKEHNENWSFMNIQVMSVKDSGLLQYDVDVCDLEPGLKPYMDEK